MKWIDESKGVLDYFFAAVPLLTLFFLITAYFHTVHPRFTKEDELKKASIEIATLKEKLISSTKNNSDLSTAIKSLSSQLSKNEAKLKLLEQEYLPLLSEAEKATYLKNREYLYFSKQEVINEFTKSGQKLISESGDTVDPSTIKTIDVKITGGLSPDLYLVDAWSCGSGGCMGPLFIYFNGAYCFSAWAHSKTIDAINKVYDLKCSKFSDDERILLSDLVGSES
ncbi:hypothetical protein [Pseudoalteromonas piscicida]|uniref:hypothetical protein n=1 Tax=Pseudoalteromonas piscicida TaxID=43662 RepID=UPI0027E52D98|nr:hypothetical protein [Pseudoalteromonas piscicida]WMO15882.1 hypothetical protein NI376_21835 [Pseudoalteromonas piscicida]